MRTETFTHLGTTYRRISKSEARKAYNYGYAVIITPCLVNHSHILSGWHISATMDKNDFETRYDLDITENRVMIDFDTFVNSFEYYNCDHELGDYAKFFIVAD